MTVARGRPSPGLRPPSPRKRGEGQHTRASRVVALLPACGEKVREARMRGVKPIDSTLTEDLATSHAPDAMSRVPNGTSHVSDEKSHAPDEKSHRPDENLICGMKNRI